MISGTFDFRQRREGKEPTSFSMSRIQRVAAIVAVTGVAVSTNAGLAQWSVETSRQSGCELTRATLQEFGGRAALVIQCTKQGADPVIYLHEPVSSTHVAVIYRFDDSEAHTRMATASQAGHVLQIWTNDEREAFSMSKRLRVQLRPFRVLDFDLRGIETLAAKLKC